LVPAGDSLNFLLSQFIELVSELSEFFFFCLYAGIFFNFYRNGFDRFLEVKFKCALCKARRSIAFLFPEEEEACV